MRTRRGQLDIGRHGYGEGLGISHDSGNNLVCELHLVARPEGVVRACPRGQSNGYEGHSNGYEGHSQRCVDECQPVSSDGTNPGHSTESKK